MKVGYLVLLPTAVINVKERDGHKFEEARLNNPDLLAILPIYRTMTAARKIFGRKVPLRRVEFPEVGDADHNNSG